MVLFAIPGDKIVLDGFLFYAGNPDDKKMLTRDEEPEQ